jgi:iron complex transport system substrate-binding protein
MTMFKLRFHFALSLITVLGLLLGACSAAPAAATATATTTSATGGYPPSPTDASAASGYPAQPTDVATLDAYPAQSTSAAPAAGPISLTDGLNRAVTLNGPAQRIVSMAPSNTELLYEVGAGAQVVGRDEFSDFPVEAKALPSVGGSMGNYNLEAITALKPDLVLAAEINTPDQVKSVEALGITVYYLNNPKDIAGLYQNLQIIGTLTGKTDQAAALVQSLQARVKTVQDKLAGVTTHPKVYYELDATDPTKPFTAGPGSYVDVLVGMAGGQNIGAGLSSAYAQISSEEVVTQNPDFILLGDAAYGVTVESVGQRPGWSVINAIKNNQISGFDDNTVSRPTARLVDALENLAKLLHPDIFK